VHQGANNKGSPKNVKLKKQVACKGCGVYLTIGADPGSVDGVLAGHFNPSIARIDGTADPQRGASRRPPSPFPG
jgi:hypothetical protein